MAYLDNIVIYFNSEKEYFKYVEWVLQRLIDKKMPIVIKKYKFYTKKTEFYRFIIELRQLSIDLKKIKVVVSWQEPTNIMQLRSFLGFCNYY